MPNEFPTAEKKPTPARPKIRFSPKGKSRLSYGFAAAWMIGSVMLSAAWLNHFGEAVTLPAAVRIALGLCCIPVYANAFTVASLLLYRQPALKESHPYDPLTILVACPGEEAKISDTLRYIAIQDYSGEVHVIVVVNDRAGHTAAAAEQAAEALGLRLHVIFAASPGKNRALNAALPHVETELLLTLDASTLLHRKALRHIVARYKSSPREIAAVAGAVLVRNSRASFWAKMQEWDYLLGIAGTKRLQNLSRGTLAAQGAFSLYQTEAVRKVGGWTDMSGENIALTWRFLSTGRKVCFEPLAVAFTDVPETLQPFFKQRSRWAGGAIEAFKVVKPWRHSSPGAKHLTFRGLVMPSLDFVYTFVWLSCLVLAFFGHYWAVGMIALMVLPLAFAAHFILYLHQKKTFKTLNLRIRKNAIGFVAYILLYPIILSPVSIWGYMQEALAFDRDRAPKSEIASP